MKAGQQALPDLVGFKARRNVLAAQQLRRVRNELVEVNVALLGRLLGVRVAQQAHGQGVVGLNGDPAGVVADQVRQPPAQFERGVAIEAADEYALRPDPLHAQQVGAAMHDSPGLA